MSPDLGLGSVTLRLLLTFIAGCLIGLDRGEHAHPAGLRTTILIALAASLAMSQANWLLAHSFDPHNSILRADMMRLPLGILTGVGFIGAGVVLRRGDILRGVTSAATVWLTTVIGLCFGGGQFGLGIIGTALALATLWGMKHLEALIVTGRRGTLDVTFATGINGEQVLFDIFAARGFHVRARSIELLASGGTRIVCHGRYQGAYPAWSSSMLRSVQALPGTTGGELERHRLNLLRQAPRRPGFPPLFPALHHAPG